MKINYQRELDAVLEGLGESKPNLLIHSCCAPCSSYVLEYLSKYFKITILYYNPNIYPEEEFNKRLIEQKRLIDEMKINAEIIDIGHQSEKFYEAVKGLEHLHEGDKRCEVCFRLRLREAARMAKERGFDYFTTTLSISPLKDEQVLNKIGEELSAQYGVKYLYSDFKKKNGYKRSIELSNKYNLYRQNYCGCVFSQNEK
ncbi:MAG: epoxyqueuosine reductase QueH [Clostridia bacterium]|nr:epoxyqueuosine reductase QueH [Clostridia bacterium]